MYFIPICIFQISLNLQGWIQLLNRGGVPHSQDHEIQKNISEEVTLICILRFFIITRDVPAFT